MLNMIVPIVGTVLSVFQNNKKHIAETAGVDEGVVAQVGEALQIYLGKDERVWAQLATELEQARQHDIATQVNGVEVIDFLRGAVRPLITYMAMTWYVYARVYEIPLTVEDYSIIGGVLAFWFGMRSFEKQKNNF